MKNIFNIIKSLQNIMRKDPGVSDDALRKPPYQFRMMTKTILFLLTLLPAFLSGQPVKKITSRDRSEVYYVLKSDKSIQHGTYLKFNNNGDTLIKGHYNHGIKDSIWEFYTHRGVLQQKYNFTTRELVYYPDAYKNKEYNVITGSDTVLSILDRPPIFIGGEALMFDNFFQVFGYPEDLGRNGLSGRIVSSVIVAHDGKTRDHSILIGIEPWCDTQALKFIKQIPDNWLPGILNGRPVDVQYTIPFTVHFDIAR